MAFNEFLPLCLDLKEMATRENVHKLFALYDTNGDGSVSVDEFHNIINGNKVCNGHLSKEELERQKKLWA